MFTDKRESRLCLCITNNYNGWTNKISNILSPPHWRHTSVQLIRLQFPYAIVKASLLTKPGGFLLKTLPKSAEYKMHVKYIQELQPKLESGGSTLWFKVGFERPAALLNACCWATSAREASGGVWWRRTLRSSGSSWSGSSKLWSKSPAGPPRRSRSRWPIGLRGQTTARQKMPLMR